MANGPRILVDLPVVATREGFITKEMNVLVVDT